MLLGDIVADTTVVALSENNPFLLAFLELLIMWISLVVNLLPLGEDKTCDLIGDLEDF